MDENRQVTEEEAIQYALGYQDGFLEAKKLFKKDGYWIDEEEDRWVYAKCSECETVHDVRSNFCPSCGALMKGGKK